MKTKPARKKEPSPAKKFGGTFNPFNPGTLANKNPNRFMSNKLVKV